jgi:hypothetical protein
MKSRWIRSTALATLLAMAPSCGYILYPERRGNHGGTIDGGTLVMDLLWLLPGVLPGVVFLIVDFTSGAIYVSGRVAMNTTDNTVAVRLQPDAPRVAVRLVTASSRVVDSAVAKGGDVVTFHAGDARGEKLFVQVIDPAKPTHAATVRVETM